MNSDAINKRIINLEQELAGLKAELQQVQEILTHLLGSLLHILHHLI